MIIVNIWNKEKFWTQTEIEAMIQVYRQLKSIMS